MSNPIPKEIPIPEEFLTAMRSACPNWAGAGQSVIWKDGARWAFRHLHTQSVEGMRWIPISEKRPLLVPGMNCSQNVLAICNDNLMVMCYCYIEAGENSGYAWCNCYGDINGDAEYDDEYTPTHWMPLPKAPSLSPLNKLEKEEEKPLGVSSNYFHVVMYRKCNDCGYIGEDLSFIEKQETVGSTSKSITIINHTCCPQCDSKNIGPMHLDKELTNEYKPPTVFYEPPASPLPIEEKKVPDELREWIVEQIFSRGVDPEAYHGLRAQQVAIAMYHKIWGQVEKQNLAIMEHIRNRQDLEAQLSSANAKIVVLEKLLQEKQEWIDSQNRKRKEESEEFLRKAKDAMDRNLG